MFGTKKLKRLFSSAIPNNTAILMYHQIRDTKSDPWETAVSPEHFQQHLQVLKRDYEVHPFSELEKAGFQKPGNKKRVLITFDDGYLDNYECAAPLLRHYEFPATFYLPTQILAGENFFWWELLDHLFWYSKKLPGEWASAIREKYLPDLIPIFVKIQNPELENGWSANTMKPPTDRCRLYIEISAYIKEKNPEEQKAITDQLTAFDKNTLEGLNKNFGKMSDLQIRELVKEGFELGAHSVHHPALGLQTEAIQRHEITESKVQLEKCTGARITSFAYPHGHYNETTKAIAREAGFTSACTTAGGVVRPGTDLLCLPRIWVKDWDGRTFEEQLYRYFYPKKSIR